MNGSCTTQQRFDTARVLHPQRTGPSHFTQAAELALIYNNTGFPGSQCDSEGNVTRHEESCYYFQVRDNTVGCRKFNSLEQKMGKVTC